MNQALKVAAFVVAAALAPVALISRPDKDSKNPSEISRSFEFTAVTHIPGLPPGTHRMRVWVPLPYEESWQSLSRLKITTAVRYKIEREKEYGNQYVYLDYGNDDLRVPFDVRITFHADRFEHRADLKRSDHPLSRPLLFPPRFLHPDHLVPIDGKIAELSGEQTRGASEPLEKARRIYDYVVSTMHYDHDGSDWGRGDALWACDAKHGNCTDFHSLFIAMARAAAIPARFEIGFSLPEDSHEGSIASYHCWAQFYIDGIGWVPIDASEAWKHKDKLDYFFGATDDNRILFTIGRDIRLKPGQKGEPLNFFIYPYAELDGKPFAGLKNEYSFADDKLPTGPARDISTSD